MRYPHAIIAAPLTQVVRAGEWWSYKLSPILAAFYATAFILGVPVTSLWQAALTLLVALIPGAAYVSVINDLTDREDDLRAGKPNRLTGRSGAFIGVVIAITVAAGLAVCWMWRGDTMLLSFYLAAWLAFSLYSLPPFRFKTRGFAGVLCDASGAHLFPTLVAITLAARGAGQPAQPSWLAAAGLWAFATGMRGILWHQVTDAANDREAGVRTFAERRGPAVAARIGSTIVFPLELAGLALVLWNVGSLWPVASLALYALITMVRVTRLHMNVVIVTPKPDFLIVMHEYYDSLLPLAILIASSLRTPVDALVIALHLALFPGRLQENFRNARSIWKLHQSRPK